MEVVMKRLINQGWIPVIALLSSALITGCGSSDSNGSSSTVKTTTGTSGSTSSCIPITNRIGFNAKNAQVNSATILAGNIPSVSDGSSFSTPGNYGTVTLTTAAITGNVTGTSDFGSLSLTVNGTHGNYNYAYNYGYNDNYTSTSTNTSTSTVSGSVIISTAAQSTIKAQFGSGECVSALALEGGYYNGGVFSTSVYLYINRTNNGFALAF